jgi:diguanylate cyclase (GGDEF)-like protein
LTGNKDLTQAFDAYVEALIAASRRLDRSAQAALAQEFFRELSSLNLSPEQSLDTWEAVLALREEQSRSGHQSSLRQIVLDVLLRSPLVQEPVVTEYSEIQRLRAGAAIDPLTDLQNRRFFDARLEREMDAAVRYSQDFSLVLLDLNRFKEVNDLHGHATGDQALKIAAHVLAESARSSDMAFRIGGDEFALLLTRTSFDGAQIAASRVRELFDETVKPLALQVPVSVAYGTATAPREGHDAQVLFKIADERLYNFKRSIGSPRCAPRSHPRIPLTDAFAILRWETLSHRAEVVDFSIGGVGLRLATPVSAPREFLSELHMPPLHPVMSRVHKVYETIDPDNVQRLGCAFVPSEDKSSQSDR